MEVRQQVVPRRRTALLQRQLGIVILNQVCAPRAEMGRINVYLGEWRKNIRSVGSGTAQVRRFV